jgi:hypothetical protein
MEKHPLWIPHLQLNHLINILGQCCRKHHGLSIPIDLFQDVRERAQESHLEDHIGLVHHQNLDVVAVEAETVLEVLEEAAGRRDHDVHELHSFGLVGEILATDQKGRSELVVVGNRLEYLENL